MDLALEAQYFETFDQWVNFAAGWLTAHPEYRDTEHRKRGDPFGWQGHHFKAICFDAKGRLCRSGADFIRARDDGAFPVRWIWPDQVPRVVLAGTHG